MNPILKIVWFLTATCIMLGIGQCKQKKLPKTREKVSQQTVTTAVPPVNTPSLDRTTIPNTTADVPIKESTTPLVEKPVPTPNLYAMWHNDNSAMSLRFVKHDNLGKTAFYLTSTHPQTGGFTTITGFVIIDMAAKTIAFPAQPHHFSTFDLPNTQQSSYTSTWSGKRFFRLEAAALTIDAHTFTLHAVQPPLNNDNAYRP